MNEHCEKFWVDCLKLLRQKLDKNLNLYIYIDFWVRVFDEDIVLIIAWKGKKLT